MKVLEKILLTFAMVIGLSLAVSAQKGDDQKKPPKTKPPVVTPPNKKPPKNEDKPKKSAFDRASKRESSAEE